jgi:HK97 family phage major capsid protein
MTNANITDPEKLSGPELIAEFKKQLAQDADKRDNDLLAKLDKLVQDRIAEAQAKALAEQAKTPIMKGFGKEEAARFNMTKLVKGIISKDWSDSGFELEACREAAKTIGKDMSTTTDTAGGFIVPTQVMADRFIPLIQKRAVALQLGVQTLPCSGSPVQIPKLTTASTAYWVGAENTSVTSSDLAFGQVQMTPHALAARVILSNRLVNMSTPAAEQIINQQLARDLAIALDAGIFAGTGASGQPTGIVQTIGINSVTSFGSLKANTAYGKLIDMISEVANDNVELANCKWAIHSTVWQHLSQIVDSASGFNMERRLFAAGPLNGANSLVGYPYMIANNLTAIPAGSAVANSILFGDFSQCWLGQWGTMVLRSTDTGGDAFAKMQTQVLAAMEVDVGVAQPTAFCTATGIED